MKNFIYSLLLVVTAITATAQTVTISASHVGGTTPVTGTITFQPVLSDGKTQASALISGGLGISSRQPLTAAVTSGAFTLSNVLDTNLSNPQNLCYSVSVRSQNGLQVLGPGFSCVQPAANNTWCVSGVCNFDKYPPNVTPFALTSIGPAPNLAIGTVTNLGSGAIPTAAIRGTNPDYLIDLGLASGLPGPAGLGATALNTAANGLDVYADSIGTGTGASSFLTGYANIISTAWGGPQSQAYTTKSGEQALDLGAFLETGVANGIADYVLEVGTNDVNQYNSSADLQNVFQRAYLHDLLWPSAVNLAKLAQTCTLSGSGTADNTIVLGMGVSLTSNSSTLSCVVNAPKPGDTLYVGYHIVNGTAGTFNLSVDGATQTDPISGSATFLGYGDSSANIATQNGGRCLGFNAACGVVAVRMTNGDAGWSAGNHTVLFSAINANGTTAIVEPDYAVFAPSAFMATSLPYGVAVTPNPQSGPSGSLVPTYKGYVTTAQSNLAADGWNVSLADTYTAATTNPACTGGAAPPFTNCYVDSIHPNTKLHGLMATVIEAAVPSSRLTGVAVANVNAASDTLTAKNQNTPARWPSPNGFGGQLNGSPGFSNGVALYKSGGIVSGIGYVPSFGVLTLGSSAAGVLASVCGYNANAYSNYPTTADINTTCPVRYYFNQVQFLQNPATLYQPLNIQANTIYTGLTNSDTAAPSGSWVNYFANSYDADPRTATASGNYPSVPRWLRSRCWDGTVGTVDDVAWENVPGSGASPSQTMKLLHNYGCGGALLVDMTSATGGVKLPTGSTVGGVSIQPLLVGSLTTTAAMTDTVTITGMTSIGHCSLDPTNASAIAAQAGVTAKAANSVTITHPAAAGLTYDVICTSY